MMKIVRVVGTVSATIKATGLIGHKLLIVHVVDAEGKILQSSQVAVDTVGAGRGDVCLMAEGSAARMTETIAGQPVDAALIAIIDQIAT